MIKGPLSLRVGVVQQLAVQEKLTHERGAWLLLSFLLSSKRGRGEKHSASSAAIKLLVFALDAGLSCSQDAFL